MNTETACTTTVASGPSDGGLASTGSDLSMVVIGAAIIVLAGIALLVLRRRSQSTWTFTVLGVVVATAALGTLSAAGGPAAPSFAAAPDGSCSLIQVDDVTRSEAMNLLPGAAPVPVLGYTIRNITDLPIDVTVTTAVTSDPDDAAGVIGTVVSTPAGASVTGSLVAVPVTVPTQLAAGETLRVGYEVGLDGTVGNDHQDATATFDSTITATQH